MIFGLSTQELPYGLRCPRNATRGLQSVLQAHIMKYLLFDCRSREKSLPLDVSVTRVIPRVPFIVNILLPSSSSSSCSMLKPTEAQQLEALWQSMANILWSIGERQRVVVVLPGEIPHIPHSHTYFQDSVTEKLYFFEFIQLDDLQIFLKRYLYYVSAATAK